MLYCLNRIIEQGKSIFIKGERHMKSENFLATATFVAKRLGVWEIIILAVTGLVCWLTGWRSLADYGTGLMWAGFLVMIFGLFSLLGGTSLNTDRSFQYGQTVMPNSALDRAQQNVSNMAQSMSFTIWVGLAGMITIVLGYILKVFLA
jgi:hypothetical protein